METVLKIIEHDGELAVVFPDEFLRRVGLKIGDDLEWDIREGSLFLNKASQNPLETPSTA